MIGRINYGGVTWTHLVKPTDADFNEIIRVYNFHPLTIEDCKTTNHRPKIDKYDDYYFLNLHFPYFVDKIQTLVDIKEVKIFWGKNFVVTIGKTEWLFTKEFEKEKIAEKRMTISSSDELLYILIDKVMKATQKLVDKIDSEVDDCGKNIFGRKAKKIIEHISLTRKNVIIMNTMFKPQLAIFRKLNTGVIKGFADNMENYWGSIQDYYQNIWDTVEDAGELIKGYSKTFDSLQVNKTNEVMKILALVSAILLPITFISSVYGMNIKLPIQDNPNLFIYLGSVMITIILIMLSFFRYKKWM